MKLLLYWIDPLIKLLKYVKRSVIRFLLENGLVKEKEEILE